MFFHHSFPGNYKRSYDRSGGQRPALTALEAVLRAAAMVTGNGGGGW
jgi:hypothetical protein